MLAELADMIDCDMTLLRPVTLPSAHLPDWLSLTVGDLPLLENALKIDRPVRDRESLLSREMTVLSLPHAVIEPRLQEFTQSFMQIRCVDGCFVLALQGDKKRRQGEEHVSKVERGGDK